MKPGRSLQSLAYELQRQLATKKDLLVPGSRMHFHTDERCNPQITIDEPDAPAQYGLTELARRQLAEKLKIPFPYFERMRLHRPGLLDSNVNTWLHADDEPRTVRILDGRVRAVLSDRYRRLDNYDLAEQVLPILQRLPGMELVSQELTETRLYLKAVTSELTFQMQPSDFVRGGVAISNSEVGLGTLSVQPLLYRLVCRNGLILPGPALRKTHIGRIAADGPDVTVFKDDTLRADDQAVFLKVRDVVEAAVSEVAFRHAAHKLQRTLGVALTGDPVRSVAVLADRYAMNERDRAGVLRHLIAGGSLSGYGLVNAVTGYAKEVDDYDRATELEVLGGRLVELSLGEWKPLAEAA